MKAATLTDNRRGHLIELVKTAAATVDYLDALQCQLATTMPKGSPVLIRMEEIERDLRAAYLDVSKEMGLIRDCAEPDGNDDPDETRDSLIAECNRLSAELGGPQCTFAATSTGALGIIRDEFTRWVEEARRMAAGGNPDGLCPICVEQAERGVGELDAAYCAGTVPHEIDGKAVMICEQCAEAVGNDEEPDYGTDNRVWSCRDSGTTGPGTRVEALWAGGAAEKYANNEPGRVIEVTHPTVGARGIYTIGRDGNAYAP